MDALINREGEQAMELEDNKKFQEETNKLTDKEILPVVSTSDIEIRMENIEKEVRDMNKRLDRLVGMLEKQMLQQDSSDKK